MPNFQEPSIHRVVTLQADVTECSVTTNCLTITFHGVGDPCETDIYFSAPHTAMAQKYADAINAVKP